MEQRFVKYLYDSFTWLGEKYGFIKAREVNEEQVYWIEYRSDIFTIKLEKYRRQFYAILYKTGKPDNEINLFNLLSYLSQTSSKAPESKYFDEEEDMDDSYRKQLNYLSTTIYDSFIVINDFFNIGDYESKIADLEKFMLRKYPELFKKK